MIKKNSFVILFFLLLWISCQQTTEQVETDNTVQGTVNRFLPNGPSVVSPAFIFMGDSLLATTDTKGSYRINNLEAGNHDLTCSALFCSDTTVSVQVKGGRTVTLDFNLNPDSTTGIILGEFQDGFLFQQRLQEEPSLADWSEKKIYDAGTGATLQYKTVQVVIPECIVSLADSQVASVVAWGQYWLEIQCGTYPLTGSCEGYKSVMHIIKVQPEEKGYLNFILPREDNNSSN